MVASYDTTEYLSGTKYKWSAFVQLTSPQTAADEQLFTQGVGFYNDMKLLGAWNHDPCILFATTSM